MPQPRSFTKYVETRFINPEDCWPWASPVCSTMHIDQHFNHVITVLVQRVFCELHIWVVLSGHCS